MSKDVDLRGLCAWLREEKGITSIDMMSLVDYVDEYNEYLSKK